MLKLKHLVLSISSIIAITACKKGADASKADATSDPSTKPADPNAPIDPATGKPVVGGSAAAVNNIAIDLSSAFALGLTRKGAGLVDGFSLADDVSKAGIVKLTKEGVAQSIFPTAGTDKDPYGYAARAQELVAGFAISPDKKPLMTFSSTAKIGEWTQAQLDAANAGIFLTDDSLKYVKPGDNFNCALVYPTDDGKGLECIDRHFGGYDAGYDVSPTYLANGDLAYSGIVAQAEGQTFRIWDHKTKAVKEIIGGDQTVKQLIIHSSGDLYMFSTNPKVINSPTKLTKYSNGTVTELTSTVSDYRRIVEGADHNFYIASNGMNVDKLDTATGTVTALTTPAQVPSFTTNGTLQYPVDGQVIAATSDKTYLIANDSVYQLAPSFTLEAAATLIKSPQKVQGAGSYLVIAGLDVFQTGNHKVSAYNPTTQVETDLFPSNEVVVASMSYSATAKAVTFTGTKDGKNVIGTIDFGSGTPVATTVDATIDLKSVQVL